jgi:DNA topoisomerase-1
VGHIRDLPKSSNDAIDIDGGFVPRYQVVAQKQHVIDELKSKAKSADEVILATDPDREGEAIAWHLAQTIGLKKPKRIVFHEITESAVQEALAHPRTIDENLRKAQEARRVLDRLFGYDLSGLIWKKVRYGLSAGRVQSPALRILMEKEREIRAFVPEKFWVITADVSTKKREVFTVTCETEPLDEKEAQRISAAAEQGEWKVIAVDELEQKRAPRAPFTTSTLQQAASTRLGFSPSRTMRAAQKLYEAGHITYMRTDSTNLAHEAQNAIVKAVASEFGSDYVSARAYKTRAKSAQEAHEAIRPTNPRKASVIGSDDQKRVYALIRARALSSQMAEARVLRTKITTSPSADVPLFAATGSRVVYDGWLKADPAARGEDVELPKVLAGDSLTLKEAHTEGKETQPPPRYSEAGLIKELERRGIGRPSTYAAIISTLEARGYVEKQGRTLVPTYTGDVVSTFVEDHFTDYISDTFTAEMEDELDEIAEGKREYEKTLRDFYVAFRKAVKAKDKIDKITNMGEAPAEFPCQLCGKPMVYKLSKTGRFMSCSDFPNCLGARKEDGSIIEPPKELDEPCPTCGNKLIEREGRFGRFIACSTYPKCKYVKRDAVLDEKAKTGVTCPTCQKGEMIERRGRFGPFYSCSNYPDCKYAIKARPTGRTCAECGSLMMEGTKTIPERCSNKACPNHNPHKKEEKKSSKKKWPSLSGRLSAAHSSESAAYLRHLPIVKGDAQLRLSRRIRIGARHERDALGGP